jgi:hypothetical protein
MSCATTPNVNKAWTIKPNCPNNILNFKLIHSEKITQIQYLIHLRSKNYKTTSRNLTHSRFSNKLKMCPNFLKFPGFDFIDFSLKFLFDIQ